MKSQENNLLCICSHLKSDHFMGPISKKYICSECSWFNSYKSEHRFKLDNLKYLEQIYNKANKK